MTVDTILPEIMTAKAVRDLLKVSRATLHRMERRNIFPAYKIGGKKFYRRSEILEAITANQVQIIPMKIVKEPTQAA